MFKQGFTLAEVLVTLGIIGVVAALTLPTLIKDTNSAQIGPKLAKATSAFEQANGLLLNANSVDTLSDGGLLTNVTAYANELQKYMKISKSGDNYLSKDGFLYTIAITSSSPSNTTDPAYMQRIGDVTIDINADKEPNANGTDKFYFSWWNDGSLRPKGGTNWDGAATSVKDGTTHWTKQCAANAGPTDATYCAGHIFENNLKVLYK